MRSSELPELTAASVLKDCAVGDLPPVWTGQPISEARIIELTKARSVFGDSDVTLSVVAPEGKKLWFDGLYLALFAKAS